MNENTVNKNQSGARRELTREERQRLNGMFTGDKLAYSVKEAAEALGVSTWFVRDEIKRGWLVSSGLRGRVLIPGWELVRYLQAGARIDATTS